jgi:hypothetical protein
MGQHFLRSVEVEVGETKFTYDGTIPDDIADGRGQGPGLRIRFDTHQRDSSTPNYANIHIFNVSESAAAPALKRGVQVKLSAGYGGEVVEIFKGQVLQARTNVRDRPDDPNTALVILATDSGIARNYAVVSKTLAKGHTHDDRVQACLDALGTMGVSKGYVATEALSKTKFPRGIALFGMAKDILRATCGATQTSFSIQNGKAQVLENGKALPGGAVPLRADTGLLGLPVQTIQGVEARMQLNGRIVVGSTVSIDSKSIQQSSFSPAYGSAVENYYLDSARLATDGIYKVYVVEHAGDTRGAFFETQIVCIRNGALPNPALASRLVPLPNTPTTGG